MRKYLTLDVLVVLLFVAFGRETHHEGNAIADIAATAAPFLIALAAGWAVTKVWHSPLDIRRGVGTAAITVAFGMILRRTVFGDGTAIAFVIVATVFNLGGFAAWRIVGSRLGLRDHKTGRMAT